ncbi:MAG: hypothetical protein E6I85_14015 [Chloroflexi bacterium]|nr:MAG: hypothetical protein E6I85_14015 [Chloroflexota bacterium]
MHVTAEAILSLLATVFVGVLFLLMLEETQSIARGTDPMTSRLHDLTRRFPRATYALAVVLGMLLGHLYWP